MQSTSEVLKDRKVVEVRTESMIQIAGNVYLRAICEG